MSSFRDRLSLSEMKEKILDLSKKGITDNTILAERFGVRRTRISQVKLKMRKEGLNV